MTKTFLSSARDIGVLLRSHEYDIILGRRKYYPPLRTRLVALRGFLEGVFSVRSWWQLTFSRGSARSADLRSAFQSYANRKTRERILGIMNADGSVDFGSQKLFCPDENWYELIDILH